MAIVRTLLPRCVRNWVRSPDLSLELGLRRSELSSRQKSILRIRPDWRVVCHPAAYKHGYSWYTIDNGNLHFLPPDKEHPASDLTRVRALTVDQLVQETGLQPTHMKIDVEGQEEAVLRGARFVLAQTGPVVALELHNEAIRNRGGDPGTVLDMLREAGYEIFKSGKIANLTAILAEPVVRVIATRRAS